MRRRLIETAPQPNWSVEHTSVIGMSDVNAALVYGPPTDAINLGIGWRQREREGNVIESDVCFSSTFDCCADFNVLIMCIFILYRFTINIQSLQ